MSMTAQAASAYLDSCLEPDGLPPAAADGRDVHDAYAALGRGFDDFFAWQSKLLAAAAAGTGRAGPCPISEAEFRDLAPELTLTLFSRKVNTVKKYGKPRANTKTGQLSGGRFESGAFGYWFGGQITLEIGGKNVIFQCGGKLVAVKSQDGKKID